MKFLWVGIVALLQILLLKFVGADVDEKKFVPIKNVPGTTLYTGVYYKLALLSFPQGWITYRYKATDEYDIQVELNPSELPKYAVGRPYELDNQWSIGLSEKQGQYTLSNRGKSDGLLTYRAATVGSGHYAGILTSSAAKAKVAPGGEWRDDALWIFHPFDKYQKIENARKRGYFLTWTFTKATQHNYFIQLANYDAENDAKFLFTPSLAKLIGRVSNFEFAEEPAAVIKKNTKQYLVTKVRYINNSPVEFTKTVAESYESKESFTYSFTQSFSMLSKTSFEAGAFFARANSSFEISGGFSASQPFTKENNRGITVKDEIKIPAMCDVEISVYNGRADNVVIPFKAKMVVVGTAPRIVAERPSETQDGEIPGEYIEAYIRATGGKDMKVMKRTGNSIEIEVTGQFTGNLALGTTIGSNIVQNSHSVKN